MKSVTIAEASEKLSELIDAALRGEEVIITKDDSVVKLISDSSVKRYPAKAGSAKSMVWMSDDFDEPLEEFKDYAKPRPKFGSAKGLIKMSDDFDEPIEDFKDYM